MNIKLKDIFIGYTSGEDEANRENFVDLFYKENNKYDELINEDLKFIISGQKGTGKTILGKYIEVKHNTPTSICKIIDKNVITLQKLIDIGCKDLNMDEYIHFFRWVTLQEISKCILSKKINFTTFKGPSTPKKLADYISYKKNCRKLENFFDIRYPKGNFQTKNYNTEELLSSQVGIETTINKFKSLITTSKKQTCSYEVKNYISVISEIQSLVLYCLKFIDVILIFDDLDELELKFDSENPQTPQVSILLKLISAIKDINMKIQQIPNSKSKCILLMRSDILTELNKFSSNLNKILSDSEVNLYWIDKHYNNPYEHELMKMIINKIKVSCPTISHKSNLDIYTALFPNVVDSKDMVRYLLDYSFGRPRDFINYLKIIFQKYPDASKITAAMVANCKKDYSDKFCKELYNELYIHFNSKYIDQLLSLLKDYNHKGFSIGQITNFYNNNKLNYSEIPNINFAISDLYKFNVIGNTWIKSAIPRYSWAYRKDGNKEVDFTKRFTVHYALRPYLFLD